MSSLTRLFLSCFLPDTLVSHCKRHRPALLGRCQTLIWNPEAGNCHQPRCCLEGGDGGGGAWGRTWRHSTNNLTLGPRSEFAIICHPERLHLLSSKESSCRRVRNKDSEVSLPRVKGFRIIFTIRWFVTGENCTTDTYTAPTPGW